MRKVSKLFLAIIAIYIDSIMRMAYTIFIKARHNLKGVFKMATMAKVIQIKFQADKNGKANAYKWHRLAARYVKMNYDEAKMLIATGQAVSE